MNSPKQILSVDWDGDGDSDNRTFRDGFNLDKRLMVSSRISRRSRSMIMKILTFVIPVIDGCIVETDCDTDITIPYPDITDECFVDLW
jgi:hypothetical protein